MTKPATILIIEDNDMNVDIAVELLQSAGFDTLSASSGESGIALAREHCPDLILMDMQLPVKDGYELCKILKSDPLTQNITIVAFTALAMEEDRKHAIACGCEGVICKPIEIESFARVVGSYLNPS